VSTAILTLTTCAVLTFLAATVRPPAFGKLAVWAGMAPALAALASVGFDLLHVHAEPVYRQGMVWLAFAALALAFGVVDWWAVLMVAFFAGRSLRPAPARANGATQLLLARRK
jgi:hypothetical protein